MELDIIKFGMWVGGGIAFVLDIKLILGMFFYFDTSLVPMDMQFWFMFHFLGAAGIFITWNELKHEFKRIRKRQRAKAMNEMDDYFY